MRTEYYDRMSVKKYFITGGAGFIGSNFITFLLRRYQQIQIINYDDLTYAGNLLNLTAIENDPRYLFIRGDICDPVPVDYALASFRPDYIVNFAAESHVDRSIESPDIFIKSNVLGVQNLLKAALHYGVEKYLQISTDEVYGSLGTTGYFTESTPLNPRSPYSASKAGADLLTQAYFHTFDLPVNITRCSNNYGPYQFPEKLIPLTILKCLRKENIPVYGDGKNIRDWIHVDDHCSAIDLVLNKGVPGEVYNIGSSNERSNIEIVRSIIRILGDIREDLRISDALITFVEDRKGHDRRYAIDATKIRKELDWSPSVSFETGLKDTIAWYLDHAGWLDSVVSAEYRSYDGVR
jgi:dTDP-glucose 4,6-dehydratase